MATAHQKVIALHRPVAHRSNGFLLALVAALIGMFLISVGLAEPPTIRRVALELTLIAPIFLYGLASVARRYR